MSVGCFNCGSRKVSMKCLDCLSSESFLCLNCAEIHLKVRCFKGHRLADAWGESNADGNGNISLRNLLNFVHILPLSNINIPLNEILDFVSSNCNLIDWNATLFGFAIALPIQIISRSIFGRSHLILIAAVFLTIFIWSKTKSNNVHGVIPQNFVNQKAAHKEKSCFGEG